MGSTIDVSCTIDNRNSGSVRSSDIFIDAWGLSIVGATENDCFLEDFIVCEWRGENGECIRFKRIRKYSLDEGWELSQGVLQLVLH